jgi:hypothetical protein
VGRVGRAQLAAGRAVAQPDHAIRDGGDLAEAVRDVDDADALRAQLADDREQPFDLAVGQARRRLVHDQHPRACPQRARDLEELPLALAQRRDRGVRRHAEAQRREQRPRRRGHRRRPQPRAAPQLGTEEQRAGDGQVVAQRELLVDQRDAARDRVRRRPQHDRLAVDRDRAGVGAQHAGQHLHQRALAGAVPPDQGDDLAALQREVDAAQHRDAVERLADAPCGEQRRGHRVVAPAVIAAPTPCRSSASGRPRTRARWPS